MILVGGQFLDVLDVPALEVAGSAGVVDALLPVLPLDAPDDAAAAESQLTGTDFFLRCPGLDFADGGVVVGFCGFASAGVVAGGLLCV